MELDVRILEIEVENFKNIKNGKISFQSSTNVLDKKADVLGVYGQNGSGKTAIVEAFKVFKNLISGDSISNQIGHLIYYGENSANLRFSFLIDLEDLKYHGYYEVELKKEDNGKIVISKELIKGKPVIKNKKIQECISYDVHGSNTFFKTKNIRNLKEISEDERVELRVQQERCKESKKSFIFKEEICEFLKRNESDEVQVIILCLQKKFKYNVFIISSQDIGYIYTKFLIPVNFYLSNESNTKGVVGSMGIHMEDNQNIDEPIRMPKKAFEHATKIFEQINLILPTLIPGLKVLLNSLGEQTLKDGSIGVRVELLADRDGKRFPFQYESDGVKKITSILSVLVAMFNNQGVFVVIDELDAGIYEFLLGEIIVVLNKYGKGQLLFTSHNLRLLEVLNKENLIFTTTNEKNRFVELKGIKTSNNIRDVYIRAIQLGGQSEEVYAETDSFEIRRAFEKAGKIEV